MGNEKNADFDAARSIRVLMEIHDLSEFRFSEITGLSQPSVSNWLLYKSVDVYGDKKNIIADCVNELQPFLDEVLPGDDEGTDISGDEYLINPEEFME